MHSCRYCRSPITATYSVIPASSVSNWEACGLLTIDRVEICHLVCDCGYAEMRWHRANELN